MEQKAVPENNIDTGSAPDSVQQTPPEDPSKMSGGKKKLFRILPVIAAVLVILALTVIFYIVPETRYNKAGRLYAAGQYSEAQAVFEALGTYKDSAQQAAECRDAAAYALAQELYSAGNFAEAQSAFEALDTYKDSAQQAMECKKAAAYETAQKLFSAGSFTEAQAAFEALGEYRDSAACAEACRRSILSAEYAAAETLMKKERFAEAQVAFEALADYEDSREKAQECANEEAYRLALSLLEEEKYEEAVNAFMALENFKDAPGRALIAKYSYVKLHETGADALTRVYLSDLKEKGFEDSAEILARILGEVTVSESTNADAAECIRFSFFLLPGETATAVLPQAEAVTCSNDGEDWLEAVLEIPKASYYPHTPLTSAEYTIDPQITVTDGSGASRTLSTESIVITFPTVGLQIEEPASVPEEGVMCKEGNTLTIIGEAEGEGVSVSVNGTNVSVDEEGRFETEWTMSGTEREEIVITASGNDRVTSSVTIPVLPCTVCEEAEEPAAVSAEGPQITFVPEESEMFNEPRSGWVVCFDTAPVFAGPGTEYAELAAVSFGGRLDALGAMPGWYLVEYRENSYGWLSGQFFFGEWMFLSESNPLLQGIAPASEYPEEPIKLTVSAESGADVFPGPDAGGETVQRLACGDECVCIGSCGKWYLCAFEGAFGWINADQVS